MKKDYTDITVILDRSGSMSTIKTDMEGGLRTFFAEQKKLPGICKVSLVQFNCLVKIIFTARDISKVPPVVIVPDGSTSLLDALGQTINNLGARLRSLPENERPEKVIIVVITDGEENTSQQFVKSHETASLQLNLSFNADEKDKPAIDEMIEHQQNKYNWQFVFLGANQDAIEEANSLGISGASAMNYVANSVGVRRILCCASEAVSSYRVGATSVCSFTAEDRNPQGALIE